MTEKIIDKIGLSLNVIGSIIAAFSVGKNLEDAYQMLNGQKIFLASILHPSLFKLGIWLIIIGFVISLFDSFIVKTIHRLTIREITEK